MNFWYGQDMYKQSFELSDGWYTIEEAMEQMKRYPSSFTDEDFNTIIDFLRENKDSNNANRLQYEYNADRYEPTENCPFSIDGIKCEYLDGYFSGDSDAGFEYYIERDGTLVIAIYADNGLYSNAFKLDEWYDWEQVDFERAINETYFYGEPYGYEDED